MVEAEQTEAATNADQYALEATDRLKQAFQFVYEYSGHVADHMKSNYDAAIKPKHFAVGSFVLVYTPQKQQSHVYGKWKVAWQGPFRVMKRLNATNYIVKRSQKAKDFIVHGDRLREYFGEIDDSAWPHAKDGSRLPTASGPDSSADDPNPAATVVNSRTRNAAPATQPPVDVNSNLPVGRRPRPNPAGRTTWQPANNNSGVAEDTVAMSTGINYANEQSSEPGDDAGLPKRPSRDRRRPARFLSAVSVSGAVAGGRGGCRHLGKFVKLANKSLSCEELTDYTGLTCSETLSVASDNKMPDKRRRNGKRRHRDRASDSSDSEAGQNGRRRPRQQSPCVLFQPRFCGQCEPADQRTRYATRSSLTKHTVLNHGTWYHPGRNEYVAIPEDRLEAMRARYRAWQSHRTKATRRRQQRTSCRQEASWTTRDRSPSPPPTAPGMCKRVSNEPEAPTLPPVTGTAGHS